MKEIFHLYFIKNIDQLIANVNAYVDESELWRLDKKIQNSGGNLTLHLIGNLNHFIGAQLGQTGYVRKRDEEFSQKNVSRSLLLTSLTETKSMIDTTFNQMTESDLDKTFPLNTFGENKSTKEILLLLVNHFSYHLGQINYHNRLI